MAKSITLNQIHQQVKELKDIVVAQGQDVSDLKEWRRGIDIAKHAVEEYKRDELGKSSDLKREKIKSLAIQVLIGIIALLAVFAAYKGVKL